MFQKNSFMETLHALEGAWHHGFVKSFMSLSAEDFRKGILLFLRNFFVSKIFSDKKEGVTFFRRSFFVSQCRKTSHRNPLVFH